MTEQNDTSREDNDVVEHKTPESNEAPQPIVPSAAPNEINLKDKPVIKTKDFVAKDYSEDEFKKYIELYEKTFNVIRENEIAKGKVVAVSGEDVLIDIGFKSDGRVSINEFPDPDNIRVGDEVEIFVEKI